MTAKIAVIPAPACFDARITPQQLRVLSIISSYGAYRDSGGWPSYRRLADQVGISRRLLISYINHLCECGYLRKEAKTRSNGGQSSNRYFVILDIEMEIEDGDAQLHQVVKPDSTGGSDAQLDGLNMKEANKEQYKKEKILKKKSADKMKLAEWEEKQGAELCVNMLASWGKKNGLAAKIVAPLIEEFRETMKANGTEYSDFVAAFQNYLRRGYLSKNLDMAQKASKALITGAGATVFEGVTI